MFNVKKLELEDKQFCDINLRAERESVRKIVSFKLSL